MSVTGGVSASHADRDQLCPHCRAAGHLVLTEDSPSSAVNLEQTAVCLGLGESVCECEKVSVSVCTHVGRAHTHGTVPSKRKNPKWQQLCHYLDRLSSRLICRGHVPRPRWMPETTDTLAPSVCDFSCTHITLSPEGSI